MTGKPPHAVAIKSATDSADEMGKRVQSVCQDNRTRPSEIETQSPVAPVELYNVERGMCCKEQRGCAGASIHE